LDQSHATGFQKKHGQGGGITAHGLKIKGLTHGTATPLEAQALD
jgi:hypothetical protein